VPARVSFCVEVDDFPGAESPLGGTATPPTGIHGIGLNFALLGQSKAYRLVVLEPTPRDFS